MERRKKRFFIIKGKKIVCWNCGSTNLIKGKRKEKHCLDCMALITPELFAFRD